MAIKPWEHLGYKEEEKNTFSAFKEQVAGTHYKDFAIQPSEFIFKNDLDWFQGNAVKYICRHKMKNGPDDLKKAIHYLRLLLEEKYKIESKIEYTKTPTP